MSQPRLRIFAGPNGSGKSTLFESLSKKYDVGVFVNADNIEKELSSKGYIDLSDYNLNITQNELFAFLESENAKSLINKSISNNQPIGFSIKENIIVDEEKETNSYEGALIGLLIRKHLVERIVDFSFETVMSHLAKIDEIETAKSIGFKTYLYFVCIDDPEVNISRVENRVLKGGHPVSAEKIKKRYYETLNNLIKAIEKIDKCYLFDNSNDELVLVSKINNGKLKIMMDVEKLPNWFINYVLKYYL